MKKTIEELCPEYIVNGENLKKLQSILLMMLSDIDYVCRKNNIWYSLCGGTMLGAIRHKGFIPWDDDIDLLMFDGDKEKFFDYFKNEYGSKYTIKEPKTSETFCLVTKVFLNGTTSVDFFEDGLPYKEGIFIDLFFFNKATEDIKIQQRKSKKFKFYNNLFFSSLMYKYPPKKYYEKTKEQPQLRKSFRKNRILGFFASFLGLKNLKRKLLNYFVDCQEESSLIYIPSSPKGLYFEVFKKKDIEERIEVKFENKKFFILKNYDLYLKNLYGNYMEIPPENKRHNHLMTELDFGKY